MKEALHFSYDGVKSLDMGIINVKSSSGLFEETFLPSANIVETTVRGNDTPFFHEIEREPISFKLELYFEKKYDKDSIRKLARWFKQDFYKPMIFESNPNRIFYCVSFFESTVRHNGNGEGYLEIEFRCDSPYSYSPIYTTKIFDTSETTTFSIANHGDVVCKPIIYLEKTVSNGNIEIQNSQTGERMEFVGINLGETLIVDCEVKEIETDVIGEFRYDAHNGAYLKFDIGENYFTLHGDFKVQFKYEFKTLQG